MNSITEIKNAFEGLNAQERRELFHWFAEREDFREQQVEDLRKAMAVGLAQADRGELAPLDISAAKAESIIAWQLKAADGPDSSDYSNSPWCARYPQALRVTL